MNPSSGSGSPSAEELAAAARERGIEVHVLRPGEDAAALAAQAAQEGAAALGIAGGDGSLAPVAGAALAADLPFACIPVGTRNHFARDAGLDPDDAVAALEAFGGDERRVDVGEAGGRVFLNNVSLGVYASVVHEPEHGRRAKTVAALRLVPAALGRARRPLRLVLEIDGRREEHGVLVCLVANNDYGGAGDLGRRERLDEGRLHVYVVEAAGRAALLSVLARAAVGRPASADAWTEYAAAALRVESRRPRVHAAVDGEPVVFEAPLELRIRPRALRLLVPPA